MLDQLVSEKSRVAVVGGGISGLAAAFHLERAGFEVDVIDQGDILGGRFGLAILGDRPVMMGGKNIGRKYTSFRAFTSALGEHRYEPFGINSSRVEGGRTRTFDSGRVGRTLRTVATMGAPMDLARLLSLALRVRRSEENRFLGSPAFARLAERFDSAPLSAHFGPRATRNLLRPMTVRMNGAEPDEVYLGTFNTNLSLILDTFDQLERGVQPVLAAIAERVNVVLGTRVEGLIIESGRVAGVRSSRDGQAASESRYDAVVVATPAPFAAGILRSAAPELSGLLEQVHYFPTTVALVQYDRPVFTPEVRAVAMDGSPCSNAGAYGQDDRHIVRYTFSGRDARTPDPSADQVEAWIGIGEERLNASVPVSRGARRVDSISRHWSRGYCGYLPFHGRFLADVARHVQGMPGLALSGDYLRGASIEACSRSGEQAAAEVARETSRLVAR
jgi:oxygen-dependent protoporphyrinogen oxidase